MDHATRLRFVGRLTYYLGWIAAICGGIAHLDFGARIFDALKLPQRNLLEASVLLFVISMASELRASSKQAT